MKKYLYRLEMDMGYDPYYYTKAEAEKIIKAAKKTMFQERWKAGWARISKRKIKIVNATKA